MSSTSTKTTRSRGSYKGFFESKEAQELGKSYSLYDLKRIKSQAESEYAKQIDALNKYEKKIYPEFTKEEPPKLEQESQLTYAVIDHAGIIRTGILHFFYFKVFTKFNASYD